MKDYDHIIRFAIVLVLTVFGFFVVRGLMIPDSFGIHGSYSYGYHRGNSDQEQADRAALFQGTQKCQKCHEPQYLSAQKSGHANVGCEICHGSWKAHNNNTKDIVSKDGSVSSCLQCHLKLRARPEGFPQIEGFRKHVADQEAELEADATCLECHDPHEPM